MTSTLAQLYPGFTLAKLNVDDQVSIAYATGGNGPPLLLLHGHPQTRAIWHKVAPALARTHTLVIADLRGYGDSSKPAPVAGHVNYSRRTMAQDMRTLMQKLGHAKFDVLAHDRGARVAHRLAADHSDVVGKMALLDIAPTLAMYEQTNQAFATAYWHWFFLIQPAPMPERLIDADPVAYVRGVMGKRSAGLAPFAPDALHEYERCIQLPGAAHGICEDYRASASIDLEHDRADRDAGKKLTLPLLILWGRDGVIERCFDPLAAWHAVATDVRGQALPCGHYIAEEAPDALLAQVQSFFA